MAAGLGSSATSACKKLASQTAAILIAAKISAQACVHASMKKTAHTCAFAIGANCPIAHACIDSRNEMYASSHADGI